jgi:hypothetical protein
VVLALVIAGAARADITTDCGAALDTPSCERLQAIYELLRDGNAHTIVDELPAVDLTPAEHDLADDRSNVLHGDIWVIVGTAIGAATVGMFIRALFWERST